MHFTDMKQYDNDTGNLNAPKSRWEEKAATAIRSRRRFAIRDYIGTLDPLHDCQEISYLVSCYEFPWDTTRSLEFALSVVRQEKAPVTCILVSDGLETCEGDACELVRQAKAQGMAITVHVIGFGLAEKDLSALECIAQAGGGQYFPANNADELGAALEKTVEQPPADGGYLSVKITLDGQPLDGLFKVFKQGETKETAMGRTYEGPMTNPRVLLLPAGTYDMEVSAIRIDGNPKQVFRDLVIAGKDTIVRVVDFSQGIAEIKVTRNGELSDAVVSLIDPATGKAVAQGRTYRS
ncbi:MAG: hypothetical protein KDC65_06620, partial [Saprospiraceae bacterium]|nr:hypothetical protein [Saprospiraceae bacterium]